MSEPRPPLDLDAIRARYAHYGPKLPNNTAAADVRALLDQVTALRAELDAARAGWGEASDVAIDGLLRIEERRRALAARDPDHDGIDWGDHPPHPAARAERTEPATGEDVEVVAFQLLLQYDSEYDTGNMTWRDFETPARAILAALDLPGRERALREENERLMRELASTTAAFNEQVKWHNAANNLVQTRTAERDAARAALAELVRLKDGPRDEEYERAKPLAWEVARQHAARAERTRPTVAELQRLAFAVLDSYEDPTDMGRLQEPIGVVAESIAEAVFEAIHGGYVPNDGTGPIVITREELLNPAVAAALASEGEAL